MPPPITSTAAAAAAIIKGVFEFFFFFGGSGGGGGAVTFFTRFLSASLTECETYSDSLTSLSAFGCDGGAAGAGASSAGDGAPISIPGTLSSSAISSPMLCILSSGFIARPCISTLSNSGIESAPSSVGVLSVSSKTLSGASGGICPVTHLYIVAQIA